MTKIQIIGNSHVGALKAGWTLIEKEHPGTDVDFFAVPSQIFARMEFSANGVFGYPDGEVTEAANLAIVEKINGKTQFAVDPEAFVVWCGQSSGVGPLFQLSKSCNIDGIDCPERRTRLSENMFEEIVGHAVSANRPPEFLDLIENVGVLTMPIASEDLMTADGKSPLDDPTARMLKTIIDRYFQRYAAHLRPRKLTFIPQATETIIPSNGLTRPKFSRGGGVWLQDQNEKADYFHMNGAFGRLQILNILSMLETRDGRTGPKC